MGQARRPQGSAQRAEQLARVARRRWPAHGGVFFFGAGNEAVEAVSSRHARVVCGRRRRDSRRDRRPGAVHGHSRIARQHPATNHLFARNSRHQPSLRFVVNVARAKTLYPQEGDAAAASAGTNGCRSRSIATPARYDEFNQPHLNIHEAAAKNAKYTGGRFVRDDKSEMLVIYGREKQSAAARSRPTRDIFTPRARSSGWYSPVRSATPSKGSSRSSRAKAMWCTCRRTRGTRRGTMARSRRAACRLRSTWATRCCWSPSGLRACNKTGNT